MSFIISKHCLEQLYARNILESEILEILSNDCERIIQSDCITVYQAIYKNQDNKKYLYRIFVNICKQPNLIVTAYKTSKIEKYYEMSLFGKNQTK